MASPQVEEAYINAEDFARQVAGASTDMLLKLEPIVLQVGGNHPHVEKIHAHMHAHMHAHTKAHTHTCTHKGLQVFCL